MSSNTEVKVPDIGDFTDVEIVEVLVSNGDSIQAEDSLISLETDKATMEVPSPSAGVVDALKVKVGDKVSEGSLILTLRAEQSEAKGKPSEGAPAQSGKDAEDQPKAAKTTASEQAPKSSGDDKVRAEVLVLGSGPGGYSAAFRAADLGKRVVLVERYPDLGGVCLNVGCIPSKALLHVAHVIDQAQFLADHGVAFGTPKIALDPLRKWKTSVVTKLTGGIRQLAKQRKVTVIQGRGVFTGPNTLEATDENAKTQTIGFDSAIVATGSRAIMLPFLPTDDARVMDSTDALKLEEIPNKLLVLGGGIIGLEMANVFCGLGAKVDVVEMLPQLLSGVDRDMVKPLDKRMRARCANVWLQTQVTDVKATKKGLTAHFDGDDTPKSTTYDRVLVAVGRHPNSDGIGAEAAGVNVDDNGFVPIDKQMRTNVGHIFAIGDVARQPLLAHKAVHEGKVAAEVAAGEKSAFEARSIPSVVYTDPEVAWTGVTEDEAKAQGLNYGKGSFPWAANGRALGMGADNGVTKILFDADTGRAIGGAAVGAGAGDLIVEIGLAIEMGADAQDIGLTIHPHPTLSETVGMSAEAYAGTITDLYIPRKSERKS